MDQFVNDRTNVRSRSIIRVNDDVNFRRWEYVFPSRPSPILR